MLKKTDIDPSIMFTASQCLFCQRHRVVTLTCDAMVVKLKIHEANMINER